jgi:hypothetical protein
MPHAKPRIFGSLPDFANVRMFIYKTDCSFPGCCGMVLSGRSGSKPGKLVQIIPSIAALKDFVFSAQPFSTHCFVKSDLRILRNAKQNHIAYTLLQEPSGHRPHQHPA